MNRAVRYALGLLVEEMGECLQLIGKAMRFGIDTPGVKRLDGTIDETKTARTMLPVELGDLTAGIDYAVKCGLIDTQAMLEARVTKRDKLLDPHARNNLGGRLAPDPLEARNRVDD